MQIKKGDTVIYGNYGICIVKDIRVMSFSSENPKESYLVLSSRSNSMSTYYIPEKNAESQLRFPLTQQQSLDLLRQAKNLNTGWIDNRQLRSDFFRSILSKGVCPELVSLLHCLYTRREHLSTQNKTLSATDEIILSSAEKLLHEELAYSLKINRSEIDSFITGFFNTCD